MQPDMTLEALQAIIIEVFPELARARFGLLAAGWDSVAIDVDDALIFKFPRDEDAREGLIREARLLAVIRPVVTMPVPDLELFEQPRLFSRHLKLKGDHLLTPDYEQLPFLKRQLLAVGMARFFAQLHVLDPAVMTQAGAAPIEPWPAPDEILRRAVPLLPPQLQAYAERTVADWQDLPPDPYGATYGFFDGHGWNMAFDHDRDRLNGVYDFADSGFGPLHQEFVYPNFIAWDLTMRIIDEYEALTGRVIDRNRVKLLTGVLRLAELAGEADKMEQLPIMLQSVADWAAVDAGR